MKNGRGRNALKKHLSSSHRLTRSRSEGCEVGSGDEVYLNTEDAGHRQGSFASKRPCSHPALVGERVETRR